MFPVYLLKIPRPQDLEIRISVQSGNTGRTVMPVDKPVMIQPRCDIQLSIGPLPFSGRIDCLQILRVKIIHRPESILPFFNIRNIPVDPVSQLRILCRELLHDRVLIRRPEPSERRIDCLNVPFYNRQRFCNIPFPHQPIQDLRFFLDPITALLFPVPFDWKPLIVFSLPAFAYALQSPVRKAVHLATQIIPAFAEFFSHPFKCFFIYHIAPLREHTHSINQDGLQQQVTLDQKSYARG